MEKDWTEFLEDDDILEPDEVIDIKPHDPVLAQKMPECWLARIDAKIKVNVDRTRPMSRQYEHISIPKQSIPDADFFISDDFGAFMFTERAKEWLQAHFSDFLDFYALRCE